MNLSVEQGNMSEVDIQYKIEGIVTVGKRGQFVLPNELRSKLSVKGGDKLAIISYEKEGEVQALIFVRTGDLEDIIDANIN